MENNLVVEHGRKVLERLFKGSGVANSVLNSYDQKQILSSVSHLSLLYDVDDEMKKQIEEIEKEGYAKVIHVIKSDYILGGTDEVTMTSYITVSTSEDEFEYDLETLDDGITNAYVVNSTWGFGEYGSIYFKVNQESGGLRRMG